PIIPLYLASNGQRYRSLGDADITLPVPSQARSIDEIIAELDTTRTPERAGRAMDHESEDSFDRLPVAGYLSRRPCSLTAKYRHHECPCLSPAERANRNFASAGTHRHRRPCGSRQIDPDRTIALRDRKPVGRQARTAQSGQHPAWHGV